MSNLQDSGAYWLGEIPKDWEMLPAWALFAEGKEKCLSDDPHLVPSRVYGVVTRDRLAELSGNKPVDNEASAHHMKHVEPHNFIISMGSHESGIEHSRLVGKVSNDYRVLLPTSGVNPEYYKWFFKSEPLIEGLRGLTTEIRVGQRIHYSRFSLLRLPLPPAEDQQRIADYLDRETAEIDAAVADLDRYLDLLNVKLDSTGREIFMTLSEEWQLIQTKFLVDITTGSGDTQDAQEDGEFPFYVRSDTIQRSGDHEFDCDAVLPSGDGAGVGKIFHLASGKFKAHQRVYVMHNFRRVSPEYFYWMFKSAFPDVIRYGGAKSTVDSVRMPMIANLKLPVPDKSTQEEISGRLANLYEEVGSLISESTKLRDLLLKRRSVLITEVVTGRKQV